MKNILLTSCLMISALASFAQGNVQLVPNGGIVCNPMQISVNLQGNGFNPVTYLWSTGATTSTIQISTSGTYTLTMTGHHGKSSHLSVVTKSATYNVLPVPAITALTDLWVCKGDTVKLAADSGYSAINWSNGATGIMFAKRMNFAGVPGTPMLDTLSVFYTATVNNVCSVTSETVLLRSIRKPHGVGRGYEGKMNIKITDSIPAGLVLEYIYPVSYEMEFTNIDNALNSFKYNTLPGSRKMPATMLSPGASYYVVTTPIINGTRFCEGITSTIGIESTTSNRIATDFNNDDEGQSTYRILDINGRMLLEKHGASFNHEWITELPSQLLIIHRLGKTSEVIKMQIIN